MEVQPFSLSEQKVNESFCNIRVNGRCSLMFVKSLWAFKLYKESKAVYYTDIDKNNFYSKTLN